MTRRPATAGSANGAPIAGAALPRIKGSESAGSAATRVQQLVELIDHCTVAKETSDRLGESFLSYLLAMTIQESRAALRRSNAG